MTTKDPYMIDPNDGTEITKGMKGGSSGKLCPRLNKEILGVERPCKVCEAIRPLWGYPKGSKEREIANDKKAKVNFFMSVCFKDKPNKAYILEVGKNAGNDLLDAFAKKTWLDVAHPKAGVGRDLTITKQVKDGYNTYKVFPSLDKADWDVPESVLNNIPNLDNIVDMIASGQLGDDNYFNISKLKVGEVITFRLLPSNPEAKIFPKRIAFLWRHWGVTEAEITGEAPLDMSISKPFDLASNTPPWEETVDKANKSVENETKEPCFGNPLCFNEKDEDCIKCSAFKKCMKVIVSKAT